MSGEQGAETWVEWGVRRTWGMVGTVARLDRRTAEKCAKEWPGELVSRTVTASEWTNATEADQCEACPFAGCAGCDYRGGVE